MRGAAIALLAATLTLTASPVAAVDAVDILPTLLSRVLGAPLPPLRDVQRATAAPLIRGPESPSFATTFRYDPTVGAFIPSTSDFGTLYALTPDTLGAGHFAFAVNYGYADFQELDGVDLDDIRIHLGGGVTGRVSSDVRSHFLSFRASYGLVDNLNVDVSIPVIHNFFRSTVQVDTPGGSIRARDSADETGIGDILLGAKYRFYNSDPVAAAARLEVSLPTGDEDDFRGTGTVQVSPLVIAAVRLPFGIRPNVNVGFRFSGDTGKLKHQFFSAAGVDWSPAPSVTLAAHLLLTHVIDNDRPAMRRTVGVGISLPTSNSDILDLGLGFKARVWRNVLLTGGVLIPLNDTGARADAIPTIGVEVPF